MVEVRFEGLETTDTRLHELADRLGYVTVAEVTGRHTCKVIGRANFDEPDLARWRRSACLAGAEHAAKAPNEGDALALAASAWVRHTAASSIAGRLDMRFKVGLWSPKGYALLHAARFTARVSPEMERPRGLFWKHQATSASVSLVNVRDMIELFDVVRASPELRGAILSPEVRRLLQDERIARELAERLLAAAIRPLDPASARVTEELAWEVIPKAA